MLTVPTLSGAFGSISAEVSGTRKYRQLSETQSPEQENAIEQFGDLSIFSINPANLYAIDKVCEKSVCLRLLMNLDSTSRSIFCSTLSSKLSANVLAAHVLFFQWLLGVGVDNTGLAPQHFIDTSRANLPKSVVAALRDVINLVLIEPGEPRPAPHKLQQAT